MGEEKAESLVDEKISELLAKQEFLESIIKLDDKESIKKEFLKYGVEISDENLEAIRLDIALKLDKEQNGEISEKELESIVGGKLSKKAKMALSIGVGVLIGSGIGVGGYFTIKKIVADKKSGEK